jgi:hypothetical protein
VINVVCRKAGGHTEKTLDDSPEPILAPTPKPPGVGGYKDLSRDDDSSHNKAPGPGKPETGQTDYEVDRFYVFNPGLTGQLLDPSPSGPFEQPARVFGSVPQAAAWTTLNQLEPGTDYVPVPTTLSSPYMSPGPGFPMSAHMYVDDGMVYSKYVLTQSGQAKLGGQTGDGDSDHSSEYTRQQQYLDKKAARHHAQGTNDKPSTKGQKPPSTAPKVK